MKLRGLKSWYETLRTCEAHAHKTSSIARYPVRLNRTMHYRSDLASFFFDRVFLSWSGIVSCGSVHVYRRLRRLGSVQDHTDHARQFGGCELFGQDTNLRQVTQTGFDLPQPVCCHQDLDFRTVGREPSD